MNNNYINNKKHLVQILKRLKILLRRLKRLLVTNDIYSFKWLIMTKLYCFGKKCLSVHISRQKKKKLPGHKSMKDRLILTHFANASDDFKVKLLLVYLYFLLILLTFIIHQYVILPLSVFIYIQIDILYVI